MSGIKEELRPCPAPLGRGSGLMPTPQSGDLTLTMSESPLGVLSQSRRCFGQTRSVGFAPKSVDL